MYKLFAIALILSATPTFAQAPLGTPSGRIELARPQTTGGQPTAAPDFGYVVYDTAGGIVKAFGPGTPVDKTPEGKITIEGADLPPGYSVKIEDGITYLDAINTLVAENPPEDSEYAERIREVVRSISDGATTVQKTLCPHPARPTNVTVEISGGFSLGVYGSLKSTVDWNLEEICKAPEAPQ